jgi:hypothetical protein
MKGSGKCYRGKSYWYEHTLWEACKIQELKEFDVPIASIPLDIVPWDFNNIEDIAYHFKKVEEADFSYPIILDDMGNIRDGYHRLVKAILDGKLTLKVVRMKWMPDFDGKDK